MDGNWRIRSPEPSPDPVSTEIPIPNTAIGHIIGSGGRTIRSLQDMPGVLHATVDTHRSMLLVSCLTADAVRAVHERVDSILERRRDVNVVDSIILPRDLNAYLTGGSQRQPIKEIRSLPDIISATIRGRALEVVAVSADAISRLKQRLQEFQEEFYSCSTREVIVPDRLDRTFLKGLDEMPGIHSLTVNYDGRVTIIGRDLDSAEAAEARITERLIQDSPVQRDIVVPPEIRAGYVIGAKGKNMRELRALPGIDAVWYREEDRIIKISSQSKEELDIAERQIQIHLNNYDPDHSVSPREKSSPNCRNFAGRTGRSPNKATDSAKRHWSSYFVPESERWMPSKHVVKVPVPVGAEGYVIGPGGAGIREFQRTNGINYVELDDASQTVWIAGNVEAAVKEVEANVKGKIAEYLENQERNENSVRTITRTLNIPNSIVAYIFGPKGASVMKGLQSTPGIIFVKIKEGTAKIGGETDEAVNEVQFKIKDLLNRYNNSDNSSGISYLKQVHYDITPQSSQNTSFVPATASDVVDLTGYHPLLRSDTGTGDAPTFYHLSDEPHDTACSWTLDLLQFSQRSRYVLLDTDLMVTNFSETIRHYEFAVTNNPRVEIRLGVTAFYGINMHGRVQNEDDPVNWSMHEDKYLAEYCSDPYKYSTFDLAASEGLTRSDCGGITYEPGGCYTLRQGTILKDSLSGEISWVVQDAGREARTDSWHPVLHWWDYKTQFSGSLNIPQDTLCAMLQEVGFEEQGTESHTTVHLLDLTDSTKYTATIMGTAESVDDEEPEITLKKRKTKHITFDIVKPLGRMSTRTMLVSENPAVNPGAERFLSSAWQTGWILEGKSLTTNRDFSVEDVRIVKNRVFWDGEYGIYMEEVEEKGTHSHGQFVRGVEVVLTSQALNQMLLDIDHANIDSDHVVQECIELFRELVEKGRELADKVGTLHAETV